MQLELTKETIVGELTKECEACYGYGFVLETSSVMREKIVAGTYKPETCPKCKGRKVVLTNLGEELKDYFETWMLRDKEADK